MRNLMNYYSWMYIYNMICIIKETIIKSTEYFRLRNSKFVSMGDTAVSNFCVRFLECSSSIINRLVVILEVISEYL